MTTAEQTPVGLNFKAAPLRLTESVNGSQKVDRPAVRFKENGVWVTVVFDRSRHVGTPDGKGFTISEPITSGPLPHPFQQFKR